MSKRRATPPAIQFLDDLHASLKDGQIKTWRDAGVSEDEIARLRVAAEAQIDAVFDAWRREVRTRLELGAS